MIPGGQNNFYLAHENIWTTEVKNFASFMVETTELQGTIRRRGHRGSVVRLVTKVMSSSYRSSYSS